MYEVTGTLMGKHYDRQLVSPHDIIKGFNIKLPDSEYLKFHLNRASGTIALNAADRTERYANSHLLVPMIHGMHNGETIMFRYYKSKQDMGANNPAKYRPKRLEMTGRMRMFSKSRQLEEALFFLLFPLCGQSPLRTRGHEVVYDLVDDKAIAEKRLNDEAIRHEVNDLIIKMEPEILLRIARGIRIGTYALPAHKLTNASTAKVELLDLAKSNLADVHTALNSQSVMVTGAILEAVSKGFLLPSPGNPQGTVNWSYAPQFGSGFIVRAASDAEKLPVIIDHFMRPDNWITFQQTLYAGEMSQVGQLEEQHEITELVNVSHIAGDNPVDQALAQQLMILHPTEDKVYLMEEGHMQSKALLVLKGDRATWKDEVKERASTPGPILNKIKKLLN